MRGVHRQNQVVAVEVFGYESGCAVPTGVDAARGEYAPGAGVDGVADFVVRDGGGRDLNLKPRLARVLTNQVLAHGGAANISGADSHDAVHGVKCMPAAPESRGDASGAVAW